MFVNELLDVGNFHLTRKVVRSYQRRNKSGTSELPDVECNRIRKEMGRFHYGTPVSTPIRIKTPPRKPPWEKEEELTKLEVDIRQWRIKCQAEAASQRVIDMYGTDDFPRIDEMGEVENLQSGGWVESEKKTDFFTNR